MCFCGPGVGAVCAPWRRVCGNQTKDVVVNALVATWDLKDLVLRAWGSYGMSLGTSPVERTWWQDRLRKPSTRSQSGLLQLGFSIAPSLLGSRSRILVLVCGKRRHVSGKDKLVDLRLVCNRRRHDRRRSRGESPGVLAGDDEKALKSSQSI